MLRIFLLLSLLFAFAHISACQQQDPNYLLITHPGVNETVYEGTSYTIKWQFRQDIFRETSAKLSLLGGPGAASLVNLTLNDSIPLDTGTYNWMVPTSLFPQFTYGISLVSTSDAKRLAYSAPFKLSNEVAPASTQASTSSTAVSTTIASNPSNSQTSSASDSSTHSNQGLTTAQKVAVGVSVSLGVLLGGGIIMFLLRRKIRTGWRTQLRASYFTKQSTIKEEPIFEKSGLSYSVEADGSDTARQIYELADTGKFELAPDASPPTELSSSSFSQKEVTSLDSQGTDSLCNTIDSKRYSF